MSRSLSSWKRCLEAGRWPGGSAETAGENGSGFELAVTSQHCFPAIRPTSTRLAEGKEDCPQAVPSTPPALPLLQEIPLKSWDLTELHLPSRAASV